jgi:hypothetical protein
VIKIRWSGLDKYISLCFIFFFYFIIFKNIFMWLFRSSSCSTLLFFISSFFPNDVSGIYIHNIYINSFKAWCFSCSNLLFLNYQILLPIIYHPQHFLYYLNPFFLLIFSHYIVFFLFIYSSHYYSSIFSPFLFLFIIYLRISSCLTPFVLFFQISHPHIMFRIFK